MSATFPRSRYAKYPWDRWLAPGSRTVARGTDYVCSTTAICQQIRNMARPGRYDVLVSLRVGADDRSVTITVKPKGAKR